MELELIKELVNPMVVIACLVVGYAFKNYVPLDNKHIPLVLIVVGISASLGLNGYVDVQTTILGGAISGLTSIGLHQTFHQYIKKEEVDS